MDDLSAAHGRSIRWLNVCVRSAVLLWSVYMSMGRLLSFVVEWRIMYFDVRMIYVVSFVFSTYCLQMSNLRRWWQFVTYICLVVCNKLYYDVNFWIWMSINMHVFTLLFCFSLLPLTCSSICTNLKVLVQYIQVHSTNTGKFDFILKISRWGDLVHTKRNVDLVSWYKIVPSKLP